MANRYLRASGNWNGAVWADTPSGSAGSASVPTSSDAVYISSNFTVSLTANASCMVLNQTAGTLRLNSYTLTISGDGSWYSQLYSTGSVSRTIDLGSGSLVLNTYAEGDDIKGGLYFSDTNLNFIAGTSTVIINVYSDPEWDGTYSWALFDTLSKTFNDVVINLGSSPNNSSGVRISGSPVIRSLSILSKNTVENFVEISTPGSVITTKKLILKGYSESERLNIAAPDTVWFNFNPGYSSPNWQYDGSSYGQYVDMGENVLTYDSFWGLSYIGDGSIAVSDNWELSNPPLAETLVDEFTSLSSSRWQTLSVGSGYINAISGKLNIGWGSGSAYVQINSVNTYDILNSPFYTKVSSSIGGLFMSIVPMAIQGDASLSFGTEILASGERYWRVVATANGGSADVVTSWFDNGTWVDVYTKTVPVDQVRSVRFQISGTRNINSESLSIESVGVSPEPTQPEANFISSTTSGTRPLTVSFTDTTIGIPDEWLWNFGDSTTSTLKNPTKTYSSAGTYTVSLKASNEIGEDTETKSNLITVLPVTFSRGISGSLKMSGSVASSKTAVRSISGTLKIGGGVDNRLIRDAETIQGKRFLYKVYDQDGTYIETWGKEVIDDLNYTHEINTIGSTTTVQLARTSDTLNTTRTPLYTQSGEAIITQDGEQILIREQTRNNIGGGTSIDYNNRVKVWAYYGSTENLVTQQGREDIVTQDGEELLIRTGAPNGREVFTGFISDINSRYGNTDTTVVQLTSYGWDLDQYVLTTDDNKTTRTFNSVDPSLIAQTAISRFNSVADDSHIVANNASFPLTGTTVSYTFKTNTYKEVLDKTLELMPSNWYYRVGLGDGIIEYRERRQQPHHTFFLGKHIKSLDLKGSTMAVVNHVLFTGGGEPALYVEEKATPADRTRRKLEIVSDNRVTIEDSARTIADSKIGDNNKIQYRTTIEVLTDVYDIESISVGETVGFRNFGNYIDGLTMQIVGLSYTPDFVQLQLDTKPPTINKRLEDIRRNLTVTENQNVPDEPS